MAFTAKWTKEAVDTYNQLQRAAADAKTNREKKGKKKSSKQEGLFKQVEKCVRFLTENPKHTGLQTHEYDSIPHPYDPKQKVFEAYAQNKTPGAYRLFWCYGPKKNEITIIAITPHP